MEKCGFLCARNLIKSYGQKTVLRVAELSLGSGAALCLFGPNGSGKSTLLDILALAAKPDGGTLVINGADALSDPRAVRGTIGYAPQDIALFDELTVFENLLCWSRDSGAAAKADAERVLDEMKLADVRKKRVRDLSGGMKRRLNLAVALLGAPALLVLDEPFSGLDPVNVELIKNLILEEKKRGAAIIFSTHLMDWAEKMVDRVIMIHRGTVVLEGSLEEIQGRFGDRFVHIRYRGDGHQIARLPMVQSVTDFGRSMEIELKTSEDRRALMQALFPLVDLESFTTTRPSLHNIFVRLSGQDTLSPGSASDGAEQENEHGPL